MSAPGRGRPVRFLAIVTAGWVGMRVVLLLPDAVEVVTRGAAGLVVPKVVAAPNANGPKLPSVFPQGFRRTYPQARIVRSVMVPTDQVELALVAPVAPAVAQPVAAAVDAPVLPRPDLPPGRARPGLSGSAWVAVRGGSATGGPVQLGGGQAGVRLRLPVSASNRVAVVGRVAAPLAGQGSEAAFGLEWRPGGGAVAVVAERRIALDRSGDGTGLGVIAGLDRAIGERIVVEGYGQAGVVLRAGTQPYADGAARALYRVGSGQLRLGVGSWGVAQREGARVDIGPSAVAVLPIGKQAVRLSLDWRQRVAGKAAPGSGLALTLGSDF
ncbi:hypothetical protein [Sphingomonas sp. Leaf10]|uniref:hypothetical protein n=1 Tax=Sphingomonas sp. Leaf10 TaxID=1735676 RepID=UPI0006F831AD|nr:hypothetical protein [Sphingomonas sp. Leaf10]KQM32633.1 hypothetical protein ASE59_18640 [Sphingomonas sp. Leaf10]